MHIRIYDDPHAWYARVEPFLLEREARHNLMFGLSHILRHKPETYEGFFLAVAENLAGEVVGAALRTLPHNVILSHFTDPSAIGLVAQTVYDRFGALPGVSGAPTETAPFVESHALLECRDWNPARLTESRDDLSRGNKRIPLTDARQRRTSENGRSQRTQPIIRQTGARLDE